MSEVRSQRSEERVKPRLRRYRRTTLSGETVAAILSRRYDLVLNDGAEIIALQPASNLYPTGISLILYSDAFDIVPPNEEPPLYFGATSCVLRDQSAVEPAHSTEEVRA